MRWGAGGGDSAGGGGGGGLVKWGFGDLSACKRDEDHTAGGAKRESGGQSISADERHANFANIVPTRHFNWRPAIGLLIPTQTAPSAPPLVSTPPIL